jgi:hypothetical protein
MFFLFGALTFRQNTPKHQDVNSPLFRTFLAASSGPSGGAHVK